MAQFKLAASGGTFDLLHCGHRDFLSFQLDLSERILLGITSTSYLKKYTKNHIVEPFSKRKEKIEQFLRAHGSLDRVEIIKIDSPNPDELTDKKIEALMVTQETEKGAIDINIMRKKALLPELKIIKFNMVTDEVGKVISSTRIRNGEITRDGKMLVKREWKESIYCIPEKLKSELKSPFGLLIKNNNYPFNNLDWNTTVTVGDIAGKTLLDHGITPKIAIVDLVVERARRYRDVADIGFKNIKNLKVLKNPAGRLMPQLWQEIVDALVYTGSTVIQVIGEEDLTVLPVVLTLPLGWKVFYGQPGEGLVVLSVNEDTKDKVYKIMGGFNKC